MHVYHVSIYPLTFASDLNAQYYYVLSSVPHPYGIAILDQWVYWTDWGEMSLQRVLKSTGKINSTIKSYLKEPMDVKTMPVSAALYAD